MEENITKALSYFSAAAFIITAISLFFTLYGKNSEMINTVNKNMSERGLVYRASNNETKENEVPGAVIIGCIKNGLETDISVNSVIIPKTVDINMFDFTIIDIDAMYTVEYVFDTSGEAVLVKYRKQGG